MHCECIMIPFQHYSVWFCMVSVVTMQCLRLCLHVDPREEFVISSTSLKKEGGGALLAPDLTHTLNGLKLFTNCGYCIYYTGVYTIWSQIDCPRCSE
jgi:hypothetical protein